VLSMFVAVLTVVSVPVRGGAQGVGAAGDELCVVPPQDLDWPAKAIGVSRDDGYEGVRLVIFESGMANVRNAELSGVEVRGDGPPDFHATAMAGLVKSRAFGVAPGLAVTSWSTKEDSASGTSNGLIEIVKSAGVNRDGTVSGPRQRVVVSMSFTFSPDQGTFLKSAKPWIDAGVRSGRVVFVAGSGNSAKDTVGAPARFRSVIGVAGSKVDGSRWLDSDGDGSNSGKEVDVAGPGCQIPLLVDAETRGQVSGSFVPRPSIPDDRAWPPAGYSVSSGTSEATVFVSVAAARVWAAEPELHAIQVVRKVLRSGSRNGTRTDDLGYGVVSVSRAQSLDTTPPSVAVKLRSAKGDLLRVDVRDAATEFVHDHTIGPRRLPESAIGRVMIRRDSGEWAALLLPEIGARFDNNKCQGLCDASVGLKGATSVTIRAWDSAALLRSGGSDDPDTPGYTERRWTRSSTPATSSQPNPSTVSATTVAVSPATPPSTVVPGLVELRRKVGELAPAYEAAVAAYWAAVPADAVIGQFTITGTQPIKVEMCRVVNEIEKLREAHFKATRQLLYLFSGACLPGLIGSNLEVAAVFGKAGTPLGSLDEYKKLFAQLDEQILVYRLFAEGGPLCGSRVCLPKK
jgi:hypothetical protein